ncbi:MAG: biopolymer transporter ExbD [Puniceicoccales bacterium]|jgi:biopolymer transport protein ExbD|nr:biopolymer transporter ExbD [Puniceicoccales bacterium]
MKISEFTHHSHLPQPDHLLDFWVFINALAIIFILCFFNSRFIFSPGITIDLPQIAEPLTAVPTTGVLSLSNDRLFFFDGHILSLENLKDTLENFLDRHTQRPAILLIRPDKNISMGILCQVCAIAKSSGFQQVQIACLEKNESP